MYINHALLTNLFFQIHKEHSCIEGLAFEAKNTELETSLTAFQKFETIQILVFIPTVSDAVHLTDWKLRGHSQVKWSACPHQKGMKNEEVIC